VSELSGAIKRTLEDGFGHVRVRGELGRVFRARSGHVYLDLKDDRAVLAAVIWKGQAARLPAMLEEGHGGGRDGADHHIRRVSRNTSWWSRISRPRASAR
jgi:hypothetical protein